jgi:ADP-heptose:LPS heptosyltransferase
LFPKSAMNLSCLVIKNDGMGDLIACSGLIAGLGEHFGGRLDLVTWDQNRDVADGIAGIRRVLYVSPHGLRFRRSPQRLGIHWPMVDPPSKLAAAVLRETRYDVAICLRRYIRVTAFVCMNLARASRKLTFWQMPTNLSRSLAERLSQGWEHHTGDNAIVSEITYYRDMLKRSLNIELDATPRLKFAQASFGARRSRTVALCIGGGGSRWPSASWIELAGLLRADGWELILFGGADCAELAGVLERNLGCDNRVGKLTLSECAGELASLAAVISNDTGLAHLASLVSPRVIVILGGGTFSRFLPWPGATNQFVLFHGLDCFDCDWVCKFAEKECHLLVRPSAVFHYFNLVLGGEVQTGLYNLNNRPTTYNLSWRHNEGAASAKIPAGRAIADLVVSRGNPTG